MANAFSNSTGVAPQGVSINDSRRVYNFGERVSELAPQQSPFFVYLSKVAKESTDDPVFKFLEQRHQWQRRNFVVKTDGAAVNKAADTTYQLVCDYDKYGNSVASAAPQFLIVGQVLRIAGKAVKVKSIENIGDGIGAAFDGGNTAANKLTRTDITVTALEDIAETDIEVGAKGQVIGSAWGEGTNDPDGWKDELYSREGYCQIFKTGIQLFSGTALATRYRGRPDEYRRVWADKLMEHKMDIEHAMLFGVGASNAESAGDAPVRYTHGLVPYTEANGKVMTMSYSSSTYDTFIDHMESFFAPETGNSGDKLVLASRKVMAWLQKLSGDGFLKNTVGTSQYNLDVQNIKGQFGHEVTKVNTIFGNLHFVAEPLFRNQDENIALAVDLANVKYRPLAGNGVSRDTHIMTNVQNNNVDGRKDMILTEAGLEISLPETHGILKWS
tara:strand:+ start:1078 stop:2403 length:1326 start_codon:yes stop_codon:yes gene_type:complete